MTLNKIQNVGWAELAKPNRRLSHAAYFGLRKLSPTYTDLPRSLK